MAINAWLLLLMSAVCFVYGEEPHYICKQADESCCGDVEALRNEVMSLKRLTVQSHCDVRYKEKCYAAILHDQRVDFNAAQGSCEDIGWKLANIYDAEHYTMIVKYLREKIPSSRTLNTAWLGMTINPQSKEMRYSSGERASDDGMKWFKGHPFSDSSYTNIGIQIYRDPGSSYQGIWANPPNIKVFGAICEI